MSRKLEHVPLDFEYPLDEEELNKQSEPPKDDGYQLWETTSEGSPISPVFETLDALCEWCEENTTIFADIKISKEKWKQVLLGKAIRFSIK